VIARAPDVRRGAPARAPCTHCGLPVPPGLVRPNEAEQFCCAGCEAVRGALRAAGLDTYYKLREQDRRARPARVSGKRFAAMDAPEFQSRHVRRRPDGRCQIELYVEGVHCAACLWLLERLGRVDSGIVESRLDLPRSLLRVAWDPARTSLSAIARLADSFGYTPHPARGAEERRARQREHRRMLMSVGVAGALAGNVMLLAFALYSGMFGHIEAAHETFFRWASMLLGGLALAWPGRAFFRGAVAALRARTWSVDLPLAIGLGAGGLAGTVNTIRGSGEIYFDSLTALVFLLLVGRWIQRNRQQRAIDSAELLRSVTPMSARRFDPDGSLVEVPIEAIAPGDLLEVRPEEVVPADGVVEQGAGAIDASALTGESRPAPVEPGDEIAAGAIVLSAALRVRATAVGADARLGRIMQIVDEASRRKSPALTLVDRLSGRFVVVVLSLAVATLALWLWLDPAKAVDRAVALLIVTCPCALGLATPLAMTVALGRAARRGVYIKSVEALESLARPGLLLLDKTGTLTQGQMSVVRWIGDESARARVAAIEQGLTHPIARALRAGWAPDAVPQSRQVRVEVGRGVEGLVEGRLVRAGRRDFAAPEPPAWAERAERAIVTDGLSPVWIAEDGAVVAVTGLGDPLRPEAAEILDRLRARGWRLGLVSGDDPAIVERISGALGGAWAMVEGAAAPERKLEIVEAELAHGPVAFVGDGLNDAAALSRATAGVAVHGGAEASLAAADIYLTTPGLKPLAELLDGARRTRGVVSANIRAALVYNAIAASLAVAGLISPLMAAVLMPLSSLTVLTLSVRLRTFGEEQCR
jgi:Cu2+-exporting ATPase